MSKSFKVAKVVALRVIIGLIGGSVGYIALFAVLATGIELDGFSRGVLAMWFIGIACQVMLHRLDSKFD